MAENEMRAFLRRQLSRLDARLHNFLLKYSAAESEILALVLDAIRRGDLRTLRERRRESARAREVLRKLYVDLDSNTANFVSQYFQAGQKVTSIAADQKVLTTAAQKAALKILADGLSGNLRAATDQVGRSVDDVFRREGLRAALSQVNGRQAADAANLMRDSLMKRGVTSFIDKSGRRWTLKHYTEMAVQTTTMQALSLGTQMTMLDLGFDVVEINRSANPCKECIPFDGKVFSLTGRAKDVPLLKQLPPFHGNCKHHLLVTARTIEEARALAHA